MYGERLQAFQILCEKFHFKIADFLLWKDRPSNERRGNLDAFCTGRAKTYEEGATKLFGLSDALTAAGIDVWRRKIEAVLLDERLKPSKPVPNFMTLFDGRDFFGLAK